MFEKGWLLVRPQEHLAFSPRPRGYDPLRDLQRRRDGFQTGRGRLRAVGSNRDKSSAE